jgi:light-regulated signal transduction histidine kinase (bacteriophytochrome)
MISNYTELLQRRYAPQLDEEAQEFMNYAIDGARRMQDLINDVLDYARIERDTSSFFELHSASAVQAALQSLHLAISDEGAQVDVAPLPIVLGDESQITQLFQNLISNSLKYRSAAPPRIQISAVSDKSSNRWRFFVKDNGKGFDVRYKQRLFGMFQRLDSDQPGTGIGLALCKKIVQHHGGHIDIDSKVGGGTIVSFTLPAAKESAHTSSN